MVTEESIKQFGVQCSRIFEETSKDMIGQSEVVENTIVALIAGGNVLLEGVPGVGKTRLVRTLSRVFQPSVLPDSVHPRPDACRRDGHQYHHQG